MGLLVFLFVTALVLPGVICLASYFLSEGMFHCRFCTWSYFCLGAGLGIWQLWRAARPGSEVSYANGIAILAVTNVAYIIYLVVQHRRLRRKTEAAADTTPPTQGS
ncbi:hypothetical protein AAFN88_07405 [Pelagibius sp. CAU 1746]|uniref:hypothetical protein n=1 Tax=Pelagibius sp. CAU 1746 TaxID=3140370 RepID=UPI00325BF51E